MFSEDEYLTAIAGERAKKRKTSPERLAKLQAQDGYTDREIRVR